MSGPGVATGYGAAEYVNTLAHIGSPVELSRSGGWLLARTVPRTDLRDASGPYPMFSCRDWSELGADLSALHDLVSVTLVPDPLEGPPPAMLQRTFEVVREFKTHFVIDFRKGFPTLDRHHRRALRRAEAAVDVEVVDPTRPGVAEDIVRLYAQLSERHAVHQAAAYPPSALVGQLDVPGCRVVRARWTERTVSIAVWYLHDTVAHLHIAASEEAGYRIGAAHAVISASLQHLSGEVGVVNLGGASGTVPGENGLSRFKRGWSNDTRPAHLCGVVLDRAGYDRLSRTSVRTFFPAYRAPAP